LLNWNFHPFELISGFLFWEVGGPNILILLYLLVKFVILKFLTHFISLATAFRKFLSLDFTFSEVYAAFQDFFGHVCINDPSWF
jgi:hypothetical protein